jgi:hypothetical protein
LNHPPVLFSAVHTEHAGAEFGNVFACYDVKEAAMESTSIYSVDRKKL